ncbi:glutamine amidotransferase [Wenzhouxiangella limi]|uniref:Glutamine amidotransferase n=1 Tax=Wenzhouxiangella limi TaxID=2707351 RepID=A0A845V5B3_9GAMM|nr:glutamine amidotransferase [Wenzhouxiangella limi]NDY95155.1 glutamine amidotransferase [Wenzhouxiangella limi]
MGKRVMIIKTGSSVPAAGERFGDFDDWFIDSIGRDRFEFTTVNVYEGQPLPDECALLDGVIVTGSPAMVSHRHEWSERAAAWLAEAQPTGIPMLGVCYGHQLLAHALGGRVGPNPHGRRMGSLKVDIVEPADPLLGGFAPSRHFQATHVEAVLEPPPGAKIIARSEGDDHHGLYFGQASWGLQFHPEFNVEIMDCYIRSRAAVLSGEGIYTDRLLASLRPTPSGQEVLGRFAELVEQDPARQTD